MSNRPFFLLLATVSLGFVAVLWPFLGAVFWAVVLAILFQPLNQRLHARMPHMPSLAALAALLLCLVVVVLPLVLIGASLVQEATMLYEHLSSGRLDFGAHLRQMVAVMPQWLHEWLESLDLTSIQALQQKFSSLAAEAARRMAAQAVAVGSNTLGVLVSFGIMMYLLYFLLRDGAALARRIHDVVPLEARHKKELAGKFATVIRATIKGNLAVAVAQGALGGIIFWALGIQGPVLWGTIMAFLSLLPAVGASLIWGPVAIYFLATGEAGKGIALTAYGILVIGLVDNLLRPILVGKDTRMPDYVVLISTLGGMALFGLTGFVIGPVIAALFIACWDIYARLDCPMSCTADTPCAHGQHSTCPERAPRAPGHAAPAVASPRTSAPQRPQAPPPQTGAPTEAKGQGPTSAPASRRRRRRPPPG